MGRPRGKGLTVAWESVYLRLPVALQNAACCVEGWRIQRTRFGRRFWRLLEDAEDRARWPADRIIAYRDHELHRFVRHAAETVPYYRGLFAEHGIDPSDIRSLADLSRIPILTKSQVQAEGDRLLSEAVPPDQRQMAHTSGTTGGGLRFAVTAESVRAVWAVWWRYRRCHGIPFRAWCGYFGGRSVVPLSQKRPPFWRYNRPGRQILFSGYHMSSGTMDSYLDELDRKRPPWLHGYPSLLALLAAHVLERNRKLAQPPEWISIGAESLLPQQAELIERAFGIAPIQHYGMAEAVANISQCPHGRLHVDEDFAATEFLPDPERGTWRVVGTNFTNPATPLLRYDVGDVVQLDEGGTCGCGLTGRIVRSIDGRTEDYVILSNGAHLGRLDHVFKDMVAIHEAQIYQDTPGRIIVRVVRRSGYGQQDEAALLREFHKRTGDLAEVQIEYVDRLERSPSGKLRFVVSALREGRLLQKT